MNKGNVILINGTSSAGKSTLVTLFSKKNPEHIVFKVDDWFSAAMLQKAKEFGWHEHTHQDPWWYLVDYVDQKTAKQNLSTQVRVVLFDWISYIFTQAEDQLIKGKNIIVDIVFEDEFAYGMFLSCFKNFNCFKVLLYCAPQILIERVRLRNNAGIYQEARTILQSFEQFPAIYKVQERDDEEVIDIVSSAIMKESLQYAVEEFSMDTLEKYIPRVKEFQRAFINHFKLDTHEYISLVAKHEYDLILHSTHYAPDYLAGSLMRTIE